jgi:aspartate aminotransferase
VPATLSTRVRRLQPSPTLAVQSRAAELIAKGADVVSMGAGEPDFDTPEHIKLAAIAALARGDTKYTAVDGTPALKRAIQGKFKRDNGFDYAPDEILVSVGGKQSFFNLCQALLDAGDEVIIPAPYWVSYPEIVSFADGVPVIVSAGAEARYKVTVEQIAAAITPKTRLLVLNSPSNPTGVAYSRAELTAIGELLRKHPQVMLASDDMYERIWWAPEPFANVLMLCPDLREQVMVLNGVSKAYSMTGWRIGYAAGPKHIIKAMKNVQSQSTSNPTSIAQAAAAAALDGDQGCVSEMVRAFKARHDVVFAALTKMPGVRAVAADGAFYSFPDCNEAMAKLGLKDDVALAEHLLTRHGLAVVPGSAFGAPGHLRLSYATSDENLMKAIKRLKAGLSG